MIQKKIITVLLLLNVLILGTFSKICASSEANGYIISITDQYEDSTAVVNLLMRESIPVYQATQLFIVEGNSFNQGDYIVPIPNVDTDFVDDVAHAYTQFLSDKFDVDIYPFSLSFSTNAYLLEETDVAVFFGQGTSGGALWHINPAENVKFNIGVPLETDIQNGRLDNFDVVTFPSGGFYSWYLGTEGNNRVRDFVSSGNGFFGTCGGNVYGVELGLLNVTLDMEGGWPAGGDLRGPITLSNEVPDNPIMHMLENTWDSNYWVGQNFDWVGPDVTVLSKYLGPTPDLQPYDPALSRAYGYYPNTEIINRFWERAAAVSGSYLNGKVVLSGTHPEYYTETQNFYINTLLYLNSTGPNLIDTSSLSPIQEISSLQPIGNTILEANAVSVISKIGQFKGLSIAGRQQLEGLEEENEEINNAVGEFLVSFLDDQIARSSRLTSNVTEIVSLYNDLSTLSQTLEENKNELPLEKYEIGRNRIDFAKSQIVSIITQLDTIDALSPIVANVLQAMIQHKQDLNALLLLREQEGESSAFYNAVLNLYYSELDTLHTVKLETEYPILKLSLEADKTIDNAEFTKILIMDILGSIRVSLQPKVDSV